MRQIALAVTLVTLAACATQPATRHADVTQFAESQYRVIKERYRRGEITLTEAEAAADAVHFKANSELERRKAGLRPAVTSCGWAGKSLICM
jgi:hypothetical protein